MPKAKKKPTRKPREFDLWKWDCGTITNWKPSYRRSRKIRVREILPKSGRSAGRNGPKRKVKR
jgi:hypothetical protein